MIESIKYAFSMYSVIPCKMMTEEQIEIGKKGMLFAFPLIGIVVGMLQIAAFFLCKGIGVAPFLGGAILTAIPVWITGGIHLDGYMDVCDAIGSWGNIEKKREILKDPHVGSVAVVHCAVYFLLMYGAYCQLFLLGSRSATYALFVLVLIFVLERCHSAHMVLAYPKASEEGMAAKAAKDAVSGGGKLVFWQIILLMIMMALYGVTFVTVGHFGMGMYRAFGKWIAADIILLAAFFLAKGLGIRRMEALGGMSGDIAGYTLQVMELLMILALMIGVSI